VVGKQFHPQSDSNNSQSSIILLIAEKRSKKKRNAGIKGDRAVELNGKC